MVDPTKIIIALDLDDIKKIAEIVSVLSGRAEIMKVGAVPFSAFGPDVVKMLSASGIKTFLDLKFHDIPNTVSLAAVEAAKIGAFMLTLHAEGGREMMKTTASRVDSYCGEAGIPRPKLLAVTVNLAVSFRTKIPPPPNWAQLSLILAPSRIPLPWKKQRPPPASVWFRSSRP